MTGHGGWFRSGRAVGGDERSPWPALIALMAVAAVLRAIALDQQLWYDEIMTLVQSVRQPLGQIFTNYTSQNQHVLYNVLARLAFISFGDHIWTLRLPAVLFGVAAMPALYFCARQWTSAREAWLACLLLTASYHHVWFSQNARGYTGLLLWTLLSTFFFIRGMGSPETKPWLWYGVTMALGLYTHLTMGFVTVGHFLVFLWIALGEKLPSPVRPTGIPSARVAGKVRIRSPLLGFSFAGILTFLLYAPILLQVMQKTLGPGVKTSVASEWTNPLWTLLETMRGLSAGAGGDFGWVALPVAGALLAAGFVSYWRENRVAIALMIVPSVITAAAMLALSHNLWPRFFFSAMGFGFVLLMRGTMRAGNWASKMAGRPAFGATIGSTLAALMILASAISVRSAWVYPKQDFAGAMQFVDERRNPDDPVLLAGLAVLPYTEYFKRDWKPADSRAQLDGARAAGKPVWVLTTFPVFLKSRHQDVWETLETDFTMVKAFRGTIGDGDVRVYRWAPASVPVKE